jgi:hypothetical protein
MKKLSFFLSVLSVIFFTSCNKTSTQGYGELAINLKYIVDTKPLTWNTIQYQNQAGNEYGIDRLQYYLSNFRFYHNKQQTAKSDSVYYVDAQVDSTSKIVFPDLPEGVYDSVAFCIGVDSQFNISNHLAATLQNIAMGWPDAMGGGYHFMRLEGHWNDSSGTTGFAMHIGTNGYQVLTGVHYAVNIKAKAQAAFNMTMNINEWFRNPNTYNFSTDGVYTMGNASLMQKISQNGIDVFTAN